MELHIPVSEKFSLFAGIAKKKGDLTTIYPPKKSLFDQLCTWLDQRPLPTVGFNYWVLSIGATALCLRWGTYLAVLMDRTKPIDPRAKQLTTSMISQDEMRRINIEASSNLARLLRLWHQDENAYFDRLRSAYEWLPMPQRRVKRNLEPLETVLGFLMHARELLPANELTGVSHPYRTLANTIINLTYRNGHVEDIHAGRGTIFSLNHRRFTDRQARQVIRHTAESISPFVSDFPLWDNHIPRLSPWPARLDSLLLYRWYPNDWSLTKTSSNIQLKQ